MRTTGSLPAGLAGSLVLVVAAVGCGKKGPPLAPLVRLPAAVEAFTARRLGSTVYLHFRVPSANQDGTRPGDVARVDVYGYTGAPEGLEDVLEHGTLVGRVPVRRPPDPDEEERRKKQAAPPGEEQPGTPAAGPAASVPDEQPADVEPGVDQGAEVTLVEEITPAVTAPVVVKSRKRRAPVRAPSTVAIPLWRDEQGTPMRAYYAVPFNGNGRRGVPARMAVPLVAGADAPRGLQAAYSEEAVVLAWQPPANARRAVQETVLTTNLPSRPLGTNWCRPVQAPDAGTNLPSRPLGPACDPVQQPAPIQTLPSVARFVVSAPSRFNVYAASAAPASNPAGPPGGIPAFAVPVPLNDKPLEVAVFSDKRGEYGVERCYVVRTVDSFGGADTESAPSAAACVTPKDVFPPTAPKGLAAVASAGGVNLIWEPNSEPDLAGYLVLRAEAPGTELQPITTAPIRETTYRDATAEAGRRYVYAVVAVDTAEPPNRSGESNRVEEVAR